MLYGMIRLNFTNILYVIAKVIKQWTESEDQKEVI